MRKGTSVVMVREGAGIARGCYDSPGSLGPSQRDGAVGVEGTGCPLAAPLAKNIELPVRCIGSRRWKNRVGGASVYTRARTCANQWSLSDGDFRIGDSKHLRCEARGNGSALSIGPPHSQRVVGHLSPPSKTGPSHRHRGNNLQQDVEGRRGRLGNGDSEGDVVCGYLGLGKADGRTSWAVLASLSLGSLRGTDGRRREGDQPKICYTQHDDLLVTGRGTRVTWLPKLREQQGLPCRGPVPGFYGF